MTTFLDLPGELRNGIYDAILNINRTVKLSENGRVLQHSISRANRQVKVEFDSLFDGIASAPRNLEAKVINFDTRGLQDFFDKNAGFFDNEPHEAKVVMSLTDPNIESIHYEALDDWLKFSANRGWNVKYHVEFDWRSYSLSEAHQSERFFADRNALFTTSSILGGSVLQRAMREAREARVRRELVQRPARFFHRRDEPRSDLLRAFVMRD